jgi:hypothetical protein
MYQEHPEFRPPSNEQAKVWRYMDFTKVFSLLHTKTLYFRRVDKFNDPFEGSYSVPTLDETRKFIEDLHVDTQLFLKDFPKERSAFVKKIPTFAAINCWHLNEDESVAMWELYKTDYGVAIQSTFKRLKDCFDKTNEPIFLGKVNYIDYEHDTIPENEVLLPFLYKRKYYAHEHEVRAILLRLPADGGRVLRSTITHGVNVDVALCVLIENIYVAPNTEKWVVDTVQSAVDHYGLKCKVMPSKLDAKPSW